MALCAATLSDYGFDQIKRIRVNHPAIHLIAIRHASLRALSRQGLLPSLIVDYYWHQFK